MAPTIFRNARIFTSEPTVDYLQEGSILFDDGLIQYVGPSDADEIQQARAAGAMELDTSKRVIAPSFIDAHVHILHFGFSLGKCDLMTCRSLLEIRERITAWAVAHSSASRILCKGWFQSSTNGKALATMLDDLDPRPIYIDAMDLHSVWCNTAALNEMGVAAMANPPGGTIHRDKKGRPSGLLEETAFHSIVIPFLTRMMSPEETQAALRRALTAFTTAGYTGLIDMAMDEEQWVALEEYRSQNHLPLRIAAHWLIPYSEDDKEIETHLRKAMDMNRKFPPDTSPSFCVVGVKFIGDGTVDGCTASLSKPYGAKSDPVEPIWPANQLVDVVQRADSTGLQVAVHAIGDRTITDAINAFASLVQPTRRHRIEHLELASREDEKRLGELGIIASVQPVHSDPVLFRAWPSLLGTHRCQRAFAYREFLDGGAPLAFGTDVPTAAHLPLPNLYNATTRRSAIEPGGQEATNPQFAVPLAAALRAATAGAAYSRHAESFAGSLKKGASADFVVIDTEWSPDQLLAASVCETWFQGQRVF